MQLCADKAQIHKVGILNTLVPISVVKIVNKSMFGYNYSSCLCFQSCGNTQKSNILCSNIRVERARTL